MNLNINNMNLNINNMNLNIEYYSVVHIGGSRESSNKKL